MKTKNHVMIFFSYLGMLFLCDGSFFCVCVYVSETFSGGSEQINLTCCRLFCQFRKVLGPPFNDFNTKCRLWTEEEKYQ